MGATRIVDKDGEVADVVTGPFTGIKGTRVYIGPTDPISDIPVIIELGHHHLHEGETHQFTSAPAALSSGASLNYRVVVGDLIPTTRTPHFLIEVDATAETWIYLYEAPTTSANGTQQTVYNRNRNSVTVPNATIWLGPTVTADGNLLSTWIVGAGKKTGGGSRESLEWDLKANTVYLIRITAKATGDNVCSRMIWYEDLGV